MTSFALQDDSVYRTRLTGLTARGGQAGGSVDATEADRLNPAVADRLGLVGFGPFDLFREAAGFRPKIGFECDDWHAKQVLVASGAGVMLFPGLALPSARDDIVLRPTTPDLPVRRVFAGIRPAASRPATVQPMLDLLHEAAGDYDRLLPEGAGFSGQGSR